MRNGFMGVLIAAIMATVCDAESVIWWEAESPEKTNFPDVSWFDPKPNETDKLSAGAWLTCDGERKRGEAEPYARYSVQIDTPGEYHFWTRKFWKHGPFRWRFDSQPWKTCGRDVALADSVTLRTHVCANWVSLGKVKLGRGKHTFELRLLAEEGESKTACFDCFVLSRAVFVPNGKHRPGARTGEADPGRFAWEPPTDPFEPTALLDLRSMNETEAGAKGRVGKEGERFLLGDGSAVRFWAVNVSASNAAQDRASIDYLARKLAKLGVNMVRYHSPMFDPGNPRKVDAEKLDNLHYLIAAMKKQGIYTHLSFYFPLWCDASKLPGVTGYDTIGNKKPFALIYFDPAFQKIYRGWIEQMLKPVNPYSKQPIASDPAVAIIEMVNEDSFFFWTFSKKNVPAMHWRALEKQFGAWLIRKYGSIANAQAKWGGAKQGDDDPSGGYAALHEAWHMTTAGVKQGGEPKRKRIADQAAFLAGLQRDFYADTASHMKKLGYAGLTSASNWHTADDAMLDTIERYTYTAADVIDRHGYFGGKHEGEGSSYSVRTGHRFENLPGVKNPGRLPTQFHQVAGYPQIITELMWTNPNRYRADAVPLTAAYAALQGCDGVYWFAIGSNFLSDRSMNKFPVSCPVIAGSLPGAALLYRQGLVGESEPVVHQRILLQDLFTMKPSAVFSDAALDALRQADIPKGKLHSGSIDRLPPFSFYIGKIARAIGGKPSPPRQIDFSGYIDPQRKTLTSITGELDWNYGAGLIRINAPGARGLIGFCGEAGAVELNGVTIDCRNEYASVLIVPMDGKPIAQSRKLLVQAMTNERPRGFKADGGRIASLGEYPFGLEKIDCRITLPRPWKPTRVVPLDENGYPRPRKDDNRPLVNGAAIQLADDAVYHVITR